MYMFEILYLRYHIIIRYQVYIYLSIFIYLLLSALYSLYSLLYFLLHFFFEIQETWRKTRFKLLSSRKVTHLLRIIYKCMLYRYLLQHLFLGIHWKCIKFTAFCIFKHTLSHCRNGTRNRKRDFFEKEKGESFLKEVAVYAIHACRCTLIKYERGHEAKKKIQEMLMISFNKIALV